MAIVVEYGPISDALGLAAQAGKNQGFAMQSQRDLQALQVQNAMQSEIDRNHATEMQDAMAQQNVQASRAAQAQQMAQTAAYQRAQQGVEQQNMMANQQNASLTQQRLREQEQAQQAYNQQNLAEKTSQFNQSQATKDQLAAETIAQKKAQTYKLEHPDTTALQIQASRLSMNDLDNQIRDYSVAQAAEQKQLKDANGLNGDPTSAAEHKAKLAEINAALDVFHAQRSKLSTNIQTGYPGKAASTTQPSPTGTPLSPTQQALQNQIKQVTAPTQPQPQPVQQPYGFAPTWAGRSATAGPAGPAGPAAPATAPATAPAQPGMSSLPLNQTNALRQASQQLGGLPLDDPRVIQLAHNTLTGGTQ